MNPTAQFWNWFKQNNKAYIFLNAVDENVKEKLLDDFMQHLHAYSDKIYFEIGGHPDEDQEVIITAEGNKEYFKIVQDLVDEAPQIEGWKFIAFKPSMEGHFKSKWDDLELNTEDIWFAPLANEKVSDLGIRIYLKNYDLIKDNKILMTLIYKMLDTILGEKSFALDIDYIDAELQPDNPEDDGLYPILELPDYIIWHKSQLKIGD